MSNWLRRLFFWLRYLGQPRWDTNISPPELMQFLQTHPPGQALDLGCGTGTNVITLAQHGWQVAGIDFVSRAIHSARRKARDVGVQVDLRVGDVTRLPADLNGPYDLILDMGCLHSLPPESRAAYIENLARLLSDTGTYLLYAFTKEASQDGPGLTQGEIDQLTDKLELVSRQDGTERGRRPSTWLQLGKPTSP